MGAMSSDMANFLIIAASCRVNIIISGGTGSGKTTLLNALSKYISEDERVITLEDAAELNLEQPHVVRMETRLAGLENTGQITMRDLVINSLRMRPDRIIIGECRGEETFEMLQAMNTGHNGSMSTLHANTPRDAVARLESMIMMGPVNMPLITIRRNIASAINLIVQVSRMNDGSRKFAISARSWEWKVNMLFCKIYLLSNPPVLVMIKGVFRVSLSTMGYLIGHQSE